MSIKTVRNGNGIVIYLNENYWCECKTETEADDEILAIEQMYKEMPFK